MQNYGLGWTDERIAKFCSSLKFVSRFWLTERFVFFLGYWLSCWGKSSLSLFLACCGFFQAPQVTENINTLTVPEDFDMLSLELVKVKRFPTFNVKLFRHSTGLSPIIGWTATSWPAAYRCELLTTTAADTLMPAHFPPTPMVLKLQVLLTLILRPCMCLLTGGSVLLAATDSLRSFKEQSPFFRQI